MMIGKSFSKVQVKNERNGAVVVSDESDVRMFTVLDEEGETAHEAVSKLLSEHKFVKTEELGSAVSVYERR